MALVQWEEKWIGKGSANQKKQGNFAGILRKSGLDVSLAEVVTLEEEGLARGFGQGVGETVAEVEAGGMVAFAVVGVALPGQQGLVFGDRLNRDAGSAEKGVALA